MNSYDRNSPSPITEDASRYELVSAFVNSQLFRVAYCTWYIENRDLFSHYFKRNKDPIVNVATFFAYHSDIEVPEHVESAWRVGRELFACLGRRHKLTLKRRVWDANKIVRDIKGGKAYRVGKSGRLLVS